MISEQDKFEKFNELLHAVYADASISPEERNRLKLLQLELGISEGDAAALEAKFTAVKDEKRVFSEDSFTQDALTEIIGTTIDLEATGEMSETGWKDLAKEIQKYSDKNFETARYLFLDKNNQIVRHVSVSSGQPSSTIIKPDDAFLLSLRNYAQENDCKVIFAHNHPSGYVEPSEADISLTQELENFFKENNGKNRFVGHIILDHGSFALYSPNKDKKWVSLIDNVFSSIEKMKENKPVQESEYGIIKTDSDLLLLRDKAREIDAGTQWNTEKWIPCFFATQNGVVKTLEHILVDTFHKETVLKDKIKKIGKNNNSDLLYLFPHTKQQFYLCEQFAQKSGMVQDVMYVAKDDTFEVSQYSNGRIFNALSFEDLEIKDTHTYPKETIESIIKAKQSKENKMEQENKIEEALPVWSINGEAFFESEIEESLKADVEELFRQYDSGEREKNLTLVGVKMYRVPTKDGKISLLVEFDSKNPENRWREDSLFNALNEEGIEFNGMKVDFNPITKEQSGTIEQYLKTLAGFENEEQLIKANAQKLEEKKIEETVAVQSKEDIKNDTEATIEKMPEVSLEEAQKEAVSLESLVESLSKQQKVLMEKLEKQELEIIRLKEENELLKNKEREIDSSQQVKEMGENTVVSKSETFVPSSFNIESAFVPGKKIPKFGMLNKEGELELHKGLYFKKFVENELDNSDHKVILEKIGKDGKVEEVEISERQYRNIIIAEEKLEFEKNSFAENSWDWQQAHERYNKNLMLDSNMFRTNTPENFIHNFRVACKMYANNHAEAMEMASELIETFTKNDRKVFEKNRKEFGEASYDELLRKEYEHAVKDRKMGDIPFNTDLSAQNKLLLDINQTFLQRPEGSQIENTSFKIGDTIKMNFSIKGIDGIKRKTPTTDFKIVKVTQNFKEDKALVYSEKAKCSYVIPYETLKEHCKKLDREQKREKSKNIKIENKTHKKYEFDAYARAFGR